MTLNDRKTSKTYKYFRVYLVRDHSVHRYVKFDLSHFVLISII